MLRRVERDVDPLDPSPPIPRSQQEPNPPVNLYHGHRHSYNSPNDHTTAAGIAALAGNSTFARNLTLPANAAFTRRQRLRWAQPPPPPLSPSPPANPPTDDSTSSSAHRLRPPPPPESRRLRLIRQTLLSRRCQLCYNSWGSGSVTEGGARRSYRRGRQQASGGECRITTLRPRHDRRSRPQAWRSLPWPEGKAQEPQESARAGITEGRSEGLLEGACTGISGGGDGWRGLRG